jgi:hypothetical protein
MWVRRGTTHLLQETKLGHLCPGTVQPLSFGGSSAFPVRLVPCAYIDIHCHKK